MKCYVIKFCYGHDYYIHHVIATLFIHSFIHFLVDNVSSCCSCAYVEILSTWEVWRALKRLEEARVGSAVPRATLMPLSCSPNFPRAQSRHTHADA